MSMFETRVLLWYHLRQYHDLASDLGSNLVRVREIDQWSDGWGKGVFDPSMVAQAPAIVRSDVQYNAYIKAMGYHSDNAAKYMQALGLTHTPNENGPVPYSSIAGIALSAIDAQLCDKFPFGTEPTAQAILMYVATEPKAREVSDAT